MGPSLSEVLEAAETTRANFNNWRRRNLLQSDVPDTTPGVARQIPRHAALELAFFAALTRVGVDPSKATHQAMVLVLDAIEKRIGDFLSVDPVTGNCRPFPKSVRVEEIARLNGWASTLPGQPDRAALQIVLVNAGEIIRRVDALFPGEG